MRTERGMRVFDSFTIGITYQFAFDGILVVGRLRPRRHATNRFAVELHANEILEEAEFELIGGTLDDFAFASAETPKGQICVEPHRRQRTPVDAHR